MSASPPHAKVPDRTLGRRFSLRETQATCHAANHDRGQRAAGMLTKDDDPSGHPER